MLGQVIELIEKHQRFAVTSHIRPDGDSLGSSLALCWIVRGLNKEAEVIMCDHVPHAYSRLPGADEVRVAPDVDREYDAVFVIECSDVTRPGLPSLKDQFVVNIDHHSTTELFGDLNWIDSTAAAVGEMIYNLAKAIGAKITPEIASCVYAALLTDTGSFHFSNTTERTFKIASELVRHGAQPAKLSQAIFYNYPYSKVLLSGAVLSTLRRDESGRIAWITMTQKALEESGANEDDSDGIINYPLTVGDVDCRVVPVPSLDDVPDDVVAAFFREMSNSTYRISLRSKNRVNVARVAESFGGGGHANAAGFTIKADYHNLTQEVIAKLREAVAAARSGRGPVPGNWVDEVAERVAQRASPSLVPVFNATGVVLHTNLGRAPLARAAVEAVRGIASGYSTLEFDLSSGARGSRSDHCASLLATLSGAEDGLAVNNAAAALVLALNATAEGKEVLISRGELIEIGGSFRIPDILRKSGAILREVGTTNRTHLQDYREALTGAAGAILTVHRSNFELTGFVASPETAPRCSTGTIL